MNRKTWDLYAPVYQLAMKPDEKIYTFMYKRISRVIRGKKVLEIATGPGLLAKNVAWAAETVTATDYSEGMINTAKKGGCPSNVTFEVADATALPYDDSSFDVVIIANALHVMPDPEKALSEIDRVLKTKGVLIAPNFVEHQTGFVSRLWSGLLGIAGVRFEHQWSVDEYRAFLEENGWRVVNCKVMASRISMAYTECVRK